MAHSKGDKTMATIYDVAKHAGTSISTVSNYLNQTKYVGPDKAKRVKEAIESLGYVPSRAAKSLKTKSSNEIHVILPGLTDPLYAHTYTGIANAIVDTDYALSLHLTNDIKATETLILEKVLKANPTGVILCTCQPDHTELLDRLERSCHSLFLFRSVELDRDVASFEFDNEAAVYKLCKRLMSTSDADIALVTGPVTYSFERQCITGYIKAHEVFDRTYKQNLVSSLPLSKEAAFRQLAIYYADKPLPNHIIASSNLFATAIRDLYAIHQKTDYTLITLGYESWYNKDLSRTILQTIRQGEQIGAEAITTLLGAIEHPRAYEKRTIICKDYFDNDMLTNQTSQLTSSISSAHKDQSPLRLLLLDDKRSLAAIKSLIPAFEAQFNITVEIETRSYSELRQTIIEQSHTDIPSYDLCSVDMPWIPELSESSIIAPLTDFVDQDYMKDITGNYNYPTRLGLYKQALYGIPYIIGSQLLFYRKDLFSNRDMNEQFFENYGRELTPPTDWFTYNQVAKFFTRKYNKTSPTTYGTCLADYFQDSILGEILPRVWGYDGHLIDNEMVPSFTSPSVKKAFDNYIEASKYGISETAHYAEDVANAFCQGDIAMITSYVSYAPMIYDPVDSKVNGLVDFVAMPSNSSMVSGWSLCLNKKRQDPQKANAFLKWFLSLDISYRYSLMTGNPTRHQLFYNANLNKLYPWLERCAETFEQGHTRRLFENAPSSHLTRETLEATVSNIIYRHQSSKSSIHSLLKQADRDLLKLTH